MTQPHPVDVEIGKRIRSRRWQLGMTQQELANECGVKFQQIQKYETGKNRVSASRLWEIAAALECRVSDFFAGIEATEDDACAPELSREDYDDMAVIKSLPSDARRRVIEMVKCFGA